MKDKEVRRSLAHHIAQHTRDWQYIRLKWCDKCGFETLHYIDRDWENLYRGQRCLTCGTLWYESKVTRRTEVKE